jgi:hypothetical protein
MDLPNVLGPDCRELEKCGHVTRGRLLDEELLVELLLQEGTQEISGVNLWSAKLEFQLSKHYPEGCSSRRKPAKNVAYVFKNHLEQIIAIKLLMFAQ